MEKIRCETCKGVGLVRKVLDDELQASCGCKTDHQCCYLCQNTRKWGSYTECSICWGAGERNRPKPPKPTIKRK